MLFVGATVHAQLAPTGENFGESAQWAVVGGSASFVANVSGASPLTMSWTKDGKLVPGANSSTLSLPAVTRESAGTYRFRAKNAHGVWNSPPFLLGVYETGILNATLLAGRSLRLEPRAWAPKLKCYWMGNGYEEVTSYISPVLQINRMPQGIQSVAVSLQIGDTGTEVSGVGYRIRSVGRPRAPIVQSVRRMQVGQSYLEQGAFTTEDIPLTFHARGLPPGISINETSGDISGTPTQAGAYTAEVWTQDGYGSSPKVKQIYFVGVPGIDLLTRTFCGVLLDYAPVPNNEGYLAELNVVPTGVFTGSLVLKSTTIRLNGRFEAETNTENDAPAYVARIVGITPGKDLKLTLIPGDGVQLEWFNQGETNGVASHILESAYRPTGDPYLDIQTRSVVLLAPDSITESSEGEVMRGTGFGSLLVNAQFATTFVGTLPDGQGVTAGSHVTINRTVPTILLPTVRQQAVIGNLVHPTKYEPSASQTLFWYKDASVGDPIAPAGWSGRVMMADISLYTPRPAGQLLLRDVEDRPLNAFLSLSSAGRDFDEDFAFLESPFRLTKTHTAVFPSPNSSGLRVDFYAPTGFFTGQFILDDPHPTIPERRVRRTISFRGMISQQAQNPHGEGFFLAPPAPDTVTSSLISGHVWIGPGFVE